MGLRRGLASSCRFSVLVNGHITTGFDIWFEERETGFGGQ